MTKKIIVQEAPLQSDPSFTATFAQLAAQWRKDTEADSTIARMIQHPAYRQIIGMGNSVIPLILAELKRRPDFWFAALRELTGVDPVPRESAGKIKDMTRAWLQWGKENGQMP